ncbi:MAG: hypothetical protein WA989_02040 [Henriciella sp.]|uniref:hypothetical protein n=1 Tax=Henriciella sp. TaxID=1968823 RepID=UPI003C7713EA
MRHVAVIASILAVPAFLAGCSPSDDETEAASPSPPADIQTDDDGMTSDTNSTSTDSALEDALETDEQGDLLRPDSTDDTSSGPLGGTSASTLQPIGADAADVLEGELRCSFAAADGGEILMLAAADAGDSSRPTAAVDSGSGAEQLYGEQRGGFSRLEAEAGLFAGAGYVIEVELGEAEVDNTEQTRQAATMSVNRVDGATRTYDGEWVCGP